MLYILIMIIMFTTKIGAKGDRGDLGATGATGSAGKIVTQIIVMDNNTNIIENITDVFDQALLFVQEQNMNLSNRLLFDESQMLKLMHQFTLVDKRCVQNDTSLEPTMVKPRRFIEQEQQRHETTALLQHKVIPSSTPLEMTITSTSTSTTSQCLIDDTTKTGATTLSSNDNTRSSGGLSKEQIIIIVSCISTVIVLAIIIVAIWWVHSGKDCSDCSRPSCGCCSSAPSVREAAV